ncbi:Multidrug resistance-associated protein 4 [Ranunculus cassubicifolius]
MSPWLTSLSCSSNSTIHYTNHSSLSIILQWLRFIFLSPCPQRALFTSINLIFFIFLILFSLKKLLAKSPSSFRTNSSRSQSVITSLWFKCQLSLTAILAILYIIPSILDFSKRSRSSWKFYESIFWFIQVITQIAIGGLVAHEKKFKAISHPITLRVYWVTNFFVVALFSVSAVLRICNGDHKKEGREIALDDIVFLISLPISAVFLVAGVKEMNGITVEDESESKLKQSLLSHISEENVAGYASASLLSRITWSWINPLLQKGYKSALKIEEIPSLSPQHRAEVTSKLFELNWPKPEENSKHPVRVTLFRCFWKDLVLTAFLAVVRLSVMYVGPILIQDFVKFSTGQGSSPYEGYYLVATLLVAKTLEVLSSHQFSFQSQRVGMVMRSTLITALYKKGIRLSSSSRQAHGVGQIVNYMAVDAQQLSDMVLQLHNVWLMPCQVVVALTLLYIYIGLSAIAALVGVIGIMLFVVLRTGTTKKYQMNLMMMKDSRMKATTEMLNNMRVIKFQAWEEHFNKRILEFREKEYNWLWKFMYALTTNIVLLFSTPVILTTLAFGSSVLLGTPLKAATIFTATSVIKILQEPINSFPQALISFSQAWISLGRLDSYLMSKELGEGVVDREEGCGASIAVEVKDGVFGWNDDSEDVILKKLNLTIKKGELAAIVGTVGAGKSSLLAAILGEMHKISGKVRVCGTTAYVAQTSWIQNGTIQENILFGMPMETRRYKEVVRVCSLDKDLEMMEFGDQTEIGERGINLSGGQKQRIQLARAVYQDCDIYLLDDVFSAVDAHTGSELFKECVRGALKNKTILLVTHQVDFLHNADLILVMRDGMIVQSGKYDALNETGLDFGALVAAHETSMEIVDTKHDESQLSPRSPISENPDSPHPQVARVLDRSLSKSDSRKRTSKLIEDEEKESGHVSFQVYKEYITEAYGWWGVVAVLILTFVWQIAQVSGDYWLAFETNEKNAASFNHTLFISVYATLAIGTCAVALVRMLVAAHIGLKTAQTLFHQMLDRILHAPMSFFDTTPSGRVLSRASTDQMTVDLMLPFFMSLTISTYLAVVFIVIVTCQVAWPTVVLILPLIWLNIWYRGYFLATSRELTRLDSITKAPVIHHFSESITGVMTIRGFRKQTEFCQENIKRVDANLRMDFHNNGANEWLGFRLEFIGSCFCCLSALFMISLPRNLVKPEFVGLSLSYSLSLNGVMFFALYLSCLMENRMVSVERIKQFINIPAEAPWHQEDRCPSPKWPTHGDVEIKDLKVRYRPNTPLILKGLTINIQGGEKIGVVGRTGSGKSTLIQAMFRVMEPSGGKIVIDGIDISNIGLHDLRSRFGIIPQEPVLFQGTVRSNIDPIGQHSDEEIWKSLERCQLKDVVADKPEKLDSLVVDSGDNWSVGQRQLLCLGRVLLKHSRILFMDEATASVDSQTDAVIQGIIREDFADCTIISIAHRIPTVMDCDKVLVIDSGRAEEYDKPSRLLERISLFAALVQEYSNRSSGL